MKKALWNYRKTTGSKNESFKLDGVYEIKWQDIKDKEKYFIISI